MDFRQRPFEAPSSPSPLTPSPLWAPSEPPSGPPSPPQMRRLLRWLRGSLNLTLPLALDRGPSYLDTLLGLNLTTGGRAMGPREDPWTNGSLLARALAALPIHRPGVKQVHPLLT